MLGSQFVNKMARMVDHPERDGLHRSTRDAIAHEQAHRKREGNGEHHAKIVLQWKHAMDVVHRHRRSKRHCQDTFQVSAKEHMSSVDVYDGQDARTGLGDKKETDDNDLLIISPFIDGRLKDEGRTGE